MVYREIESSAEKYIFSRNHLVSEISKEEIISDILIQSIKSKLKDHSKDEVGNEKKQILDSIKTNFPLKFSSQVNEKQLIFRMKNVGLMNIVYN